MKVLFIILALSTSAQAQIGVGHSVPLWGKTIETAEISVQVDRLSVHYFHNYRSDRFVKNGVPKKSTNTSAFGLSFMTMRTKYINIGGLVTSNRFPSYLSTHLNFIIQLNIPINRFVITYSHVSNGFKLLHDTNVGYDSIKLSMLF